MSRTPDPNDRKPPRETSEQDDPALSDRASLEITPEGGLKAEATSSSPEGVERNSRSVAWVACVVGAPLSFAGLLARDVNFWLALAAAGMFAAAALALLFLTPRSNPRS